jgi:MFS family permease
LAETGSTDQQLNLFHDFLALTATLPSETLLNIQPLRDNARVLLASLMGTTVEFYDFFIYATAAALVFGPLFFPTQSPAAQTLFAFMSFGVAFIARPIGAIAFGHFGDRIGRKSTLVISLLMMGVSTLAIAFLPTYAMVGWIAPALLCLMRFGQGFALGGEWGGAALLAVENAPKGWEARFGAAPQLGSPLGFLAANGMFLLLGACLTDAEFKAWGWRIPFLVSAILVALGLWIRLRITETAAFSAALRRNPAVHVPITQVLSKHLRAVLAGGAGVIITFATFYLTTAYALAQATGPLGYARESFLALQLGTNVFYALGIVIASIYADRTTPGKTIYAGAVAMVFIGLMFGFGLSAGSFALAGVTLAIAMFALGFANAPLGCWLSQLFPVRVRYTGMSVAFNTGGIIGGALTPVAAQMMSAAGAAEYVGLLLSAAGLLTVIGVKLSRPVDPDSE